MIVTCLLAVALVQWLLVERASASAAHARLADVTGSIDKPAEAPRDVFVTITDAHGTLSSVHLPEGFPVQQDIDAVRRTGITRSRSLSVDGHEYLIRTERSGSRVIQAGLDRQPDEDESRRLIAGLLWAGLFGVVLAALMAYWLARRAVAPMADTIALQRRFVADASHELRTPLTLLSTRVQLLSRRVKSGQSSPADLSGDIDGVLADTHNLTGILDELLIAVDTREDAAREIRDIAILAAEVVDSAQAEARSRGLDLSVRAEGVTTVAASIAALRRAIVALVDNALDHADHRVEVRVRRSGRQVILEVQDDGPGISPDLIPRMFDRFATSRAPSEHAAARRHYGLGLALVSEVASAHGGRVTAANNVGEPGASISLALPAHR
ncbi:MAG: histidine kinase [Marmoricola sp.]|nr:histidine kinase [Marmoricola sp.]